MLVRMEPSAQLCIAVAGGSPLTNLMHFPHLTWGMLRQINEDLKTREGWLNRVTIHSVAKIPCTTKMDAFVVDRTQAGYDTLRS